MPCESKLYCKFVMPLYRSFPTRNMKSQSTSYSHFVTIAQYLLRTRKNPASEPLREHTKKKKERKSVNRIQRVQAIWICDQLQQMSQFPNVDFFASYLSFKLGSLNCLTFFGFANPSRLKVLKFWTWICTMFLSPFASSKNGPQNLSNLETKP